MKTILASIILLINFNSILAQDKSTPIELEISLLEAYKETLEKDRFSWYYPSRLRQYSIPGDSAIQRKYDIEIKIKNVSSEPIFIWLMNCSWDDGFIINNDYIFFDGIECDRNFPESYLINPNKEIIYIGTLRKHIKYDYPVNQGYGYSYWCESTRIGLVVVNEFTEERIGPGEYTRRIHDKSLWQIYWSNPLYLLKYD